MENQQPSVNYRSIKKNAQKYIVNVGEIYGVYEVVEEVKIPTSKCYITKWKCRNINTGKEFLYGASYIHKLGERVNNKFKEEYQLGFRRYLYRAYKLGANSRHHSFNLSFEDFNNIISKPCYYCGEPPREVSKEILIKRGDTHQPPIKYNGVDRINPDIGYQIDNCVPCCPICNYMKHTLQEHEFLSHIQKIYNHKINKGSTTIPKGSTSQANGDGSGSPLTGKAEGEDIVSTSMET